MALDNRHMTLGVISLGLAIGVTWSIAVFVLGMAAWLFGWGIEAASALSSLYIGFGPSFVGAITGAAWGFVDGLILGALIAWFYNRFLLVRQHALPPHKD